MSQISRRDFLRQAGLAGITAGASAGLGGLLAACASTGHTTTTGAAPTTSVPGTGGPPPSGPQTPTSTSVSADVEQGGEFKTGYALPITGAMAGFGAAAAWQIEWFAKNVWKDGLVMADGKKHALTVVQRDTQSDSNTASQVAEDLIVNEKVALIGASAGAATVVPVREVAENFGCPCITYDCPGDAWNDGQPEGGFQWCWHTWFVLRDLASNFVGLWDALPTNKKVAGLYPKDADGTAFGDALPLVFQAKGYDYLDSGRFDAGTQDYEAIIDLMRKGGIEILTGALGAENYSTFWKQAVARGFRPKASTQAKALLLPAGVEALSDQGGGQTMECWFHPEFPFTSTTTGLTPRRLCDLWEQEQGLQWIQPLCYFAQFEIWTDVLSRCAQPTRKDEIVNAVKQTKLTTVGGVVDWTVNPEPYSGFYNFSTKPVAAGQWVKGSRKWQYDMQIVASVTQPEITTTAAVRELVYPS